MNKEIDQEKLASPSTVEAEYTAPRIETVITPADLDREVHYAGAQDSLNLGQP